MRKPTKTLMVLGAGPNQLPLIEQAVGSGHHVVTVDYLPDNVGHRISHRLVQCSTVDLEGVLGAAREIGIDGIATCASDVATPTVGYVAEQLGLPGSGARAARVMADKALFREFQRAAGVAVPGFRVGTSFDQIAQRLSGLTPPLVVKPVDTSGSRGVARIDDLDRRRLEGAFDEARGFSRSGRVCVEEFVTGHDVSGDGFLIAGELRALITRKHKKGLIPLGHEMPTHLSPPEEEDVLAEVARVCAELGYADGPLDFDVRVSDAGATVLEMSPRLGGNAIPALIRHSAGVDIVGATVAFVLGDEVDLPRHWVVRQSCASRVLGSEVGGVVEGVADCREIAAAVPEILECAVHVRPGDVVEPFVHSANGFGHVLFRCDGEDSFDLVGNRVTRALALEIVPVRSTSGVPVG